MPSGRCERRQRRASLGAAEQQPVEVREQRGLHRHRVVALNGANPPCQFADSCAVRTLGDDRKFNTMAPSRSAGTSWTEWGAGINQ